MTDLTLNDLYDARLSLAKKRPYLSAVLWSLRPTPARGLGTLGVTEDLRLLWDPQVTWRGEELEAVLFHEAMHIISDHFTRAERMGFRSKNKDKAKKFNQVIWMKATDCEINDDIAADGFKLPEFPGDPPGRPLTPAQFNLAEGCIAEYYYNVLNKKSKINSLDDKPKCGCHTIELQVAEHGVLSDGSQPGRADKGHLKQILQETSEAISDYAASKARGEAKDAPQGKWSGPRPGQMDETLSKISLDIQRQYGNNWRKLLGQIIRGSAARSAGQVDFTFSKPSRRAPSGIILPSLYKPQPKVIVVLDISSSMEGRPAQFSISVLKEIIHACGVEWLTIIPTNHAAHSATRIRRHSIADQLDFGGGTDMPTGINASYMHRPDLVIVVTDGETHWQNTKRTRDVPIAVALIDPGDRALSDVPQWMKSIPITIPEDFQPDGQ